MKKMRLRRYSGMCLALGLIGSLLAGCATSSSTTSAPGGPTTTPGGQPAALPHYDHVVMVIEENRSYDAVAGAVSAPYINSLARQGALFTDSHAVSHPSEPNYLALFAGDTFGLASDACPQTLHAANLASALDAQHLNFTGYSESLPSVGYTGCTAGSSFNAPYARKHNPWADFPDIAASTNQPMSAWPTDYTQLPTVAIVVPNQQHDMHSGTTAAGDAWLKAHLAAYVTWASSHNSLLILTFDEDDGGASNHILTVFVGAHIAPGQYSTTIDHYSVLRTIEALYHLPYTGQAANATTITECWQG